MEWTAENNKETINGLLDDYADLLAVYRDFVHQNLDAELPTKLKALQTLKSLATTIDTLLKRWSFAYRGYDGNTHQAREDATRSLAERTSLTDSEEEDDFHDGDDAEWVELKIVLRDVPEIQENGHPMDGKPFTPSAEPMPVSPPPVKKTKTEVVAEIFEVLESGEQTTAVIAEAIGRSERSVRRDLTALISDGKVSVVKKGVYRLHRSVKWTEADNEVLINELLGVYTVLIDACKGDVKEMFGNPQEISTTEKHRCVKTFNGCVATLDRLMKRWSLVHRGWHTNPRLAKADAEAKKHDAEKVDFASAPLERSYRRDEVGRHRQWVG
jgi:DNA-binding transcriptional ArsR family regulator